MSKIKEKKSKAGKARAAALSQEDRKKIAKKAALTRWGMKATHRGSFKKDFGIDVDCYVLNDEKKTAVISQRGMAEAIGLTGTSGRTLPRFLETKAMEPYIGAELKKKIEKPVVFQSFSVVPESKKGVVTYGYDVTILIDICKAIVEAEQDEKLSQSRREIIKQARIIMHASAKLGIQNLAYALSGYDATRDEIIQSFKAFVRDEAREYEKEFPDQLYEQWYRLYDIKRPARNKPWKFMHLTNEQVYQLLAKSSGRILELAKNKRADKNETNKRLHQFLSDIGVKALRQHLGQLLGIAKISNTKEEYEAFIEKVFDGNKEVDIN